MVICQICGMKFIDFNDLEAHLSIHNISAKDYYLFYEKKAKNAPFCEICGNFAQFVSLNFGFSKFCSNQCLISAKYDTETIFGENSHVPISSGQLFLFNMVKKRWSDAILNYHKILPFKFIDIYVPQLNLCIEYDGMHWHKDNLRKDLARVNDLRNLGYKSINFRVYEENYDSFYYMAIIEEFIRMDKQFAWIEVGKC